MSPSEQFLRRFNVIAAVLLLLPAVALVLLLPLVENSDALRDRIQQALGDALGADVSIESVHLCALGAVRLEAVTMRPRASPEGHGELTQLEALTVQFGWFSLPSRTLRAVTVAHPVVQANLGSESHWSLPQEEAEGTPWHIGSVRIEEFEVTLQLPSGYPAERVLARGGPVTAEQVTTEKAVNLCLEHPIDISLQGPQAEVQVRVARIDADLDFQREEPRVTAVVSVESISGLQKPLYSMMSGLSSEGVTVPDQIDSLEVQGLWSGPFSPAGMGDAYITLGGIDLNASGFTMSDISLKTRLHWKGGDGKSLDPLSVFATLDWTQQRHLRLVGREFVETFPVHASISNLRMRLPKGEEKKSGVWGSMHADFGDLPGLWIPLYHYQDVAVGFALGTFDLQEVSWSRDAEGKDRIDLRGRSTANHLAVVQWPELDGPYRSASLQLLDDLGLNCSIGVEEGLLSLNLQSEGAQSREGEIIAGQLRMNLDLPLGPAQTEVTPGVFLPTLSTLPQSDKYIIVEEVSLSALLDRLFETLEIRFPDFALGGTLRLTSAHEEGRNTSTLLFKDLQWLRQRGEEAFGVAHAQGWIRLATVDLSSLVRLFLHGEARSVGLAAHLDEWDFRWGPLGMQGGGKEVPGADLQLRGHYLAAVTGEAPARQLLQLSHVQAKVPNYTLLWKGQPTPLDSHDGAHPFSLQLGREESHEPVVSINPDHRSVRWSNLRYSIGDGIMVSSPKAYVAFVPPGPADAETRHIEVDVDIADLDLVVDTLDMIVETRDEAGPAKAEERKGPPLPWNLPFDQAVIGFRVPQQQFDVELGDTRWEWGAAMQGKLSLKRLRESSFEGWQLQADAKADDVFFYDADFAVMGTGFVVEPLQLRATIPRHGGVLPFRTALEVRGELATDLMTLSEEAFRIEARGKLDLEERTILLEAEEDRPGLELHARNAEGDRFLSIEAHGAHASYSEEPVLIMEQATARVPDFGEVHRILQVPDEDEEEPPPSTVSGTGQFELTRFEWDTPDWSAEGELHIETMSWTHPTLALRELEARVPFFLGSASPSGRVETGSVRWHSLRLGREHLLQVKVLSGKGEEEKLNELFIETAGNELRMIDSARIEVASGALQLRNLHWQRLFSENAQLTMDLETARPLELAELTRAYAPTELPGQVSLQLPGIRSCGGTVDLRGTSEAPGFIEADVFGGHARVHGLTVRTEGEAPELRLSAVMSNLKLADLSRTLVLWYAPDAGVDVPPMTGRLEARVENLEWGEEGLTRFLIDCRAVREKGHRLELTARAAHALYYASSGKEAGIEAFFAREVWHYRRFGLFASLEQGDRFTLRGKYIDDGKWSELTLEQLRRGEVPAEEEYILVGTALGGLDIILATPGVPIRWSSLMRRIRKITSGKLKKRFDW